VVTKRGGMNWNDRGDGLIEARFYHELGRNIEAKRKQRKLLQQALAAEVGIHRNTLMRYESGEYPIPLWVLLRLCDILECNHLMVLPSKEHVWGADLQKLTTEVNRKRGVRSERDKPLSEEEQQWA
jgi:transcriptional regulator with XRE-family HTH domain